LLKWNLCGPIFKQAFGSGRTIENSPAFQRREGLVERRVPEGRLK
jgi:hypothetical protein